MNSSMDVNEYLKQNAPDITIKSSTYKEEYLPKQFNTALFGEKQTEATKDMIEIIQEWLAQPLIEDKAKDDTIRINREKNFPEEVTNVLQTHRAHPKQITSTLVALNVLIRNARESNLENMFAGYQQKLDEAAEWYRIFNTLRNHIYSVQSHVWQEIIPMLAKDEEDSFTYSPHETINKKIAQQIKVIERIAIEMLQKLGQ